jgi:hypothetical protein
LSDEVSNSTGVRNQLNGRLAAFLQAGLLLVACFSPVCLWAEGDTIGLAAPQKSQVEKVFPQKPSYSPYAGRNYPTRPFFGDTHLHTSFSMDAGALGARLTPKDAYLFASGAELRTSSGQQAKLSRPLDFLVVADQSDNMGFFPDLFAGKPQILANPTGRIWYDMLQSGQGGQAALEIIVAFSQGTFPKELMYFPDTDQYRDAWNVTIEAADAHQRLPAHIGYSKGVPMGGDLAAAPEGKSPRFLVAALKDPMGANLDRYQVVKGWLDSKGKLHEKVYDVAWSGDRTPDPQTGKVPSVGSTVDVESATWTNTMGAPELAVVREDPDFDPSEPAFYYGRVIEIPTPRWTAYDAQRFNISALPDTRMTITERAYTAPIWYTPGQ